MQSTGKHDKEFKLLSRNPLTTCQSFGDSEGLVSATNKPPTLWGCTRITNFQGDSWGAADDNSGAIQSFHKDYGISYISNNPTCFDLNITCLGFLAENRVIGVRNFAVLNLWGW